MSKKIIKRKIKRKVKKKIIKKRVPLTPKKPTLNENVRTM